MTKDQVPVILGGSFADPRSDEEIVEMGDISSMEERGREHYRRAQAMWRAADRKKAEYSQRMQALLNQRADDAP
jgi:flagellar biosynthesis regulator FlaF